MKSFKQQQKGDLVMMFICIIFMAYSYYVVESLFLFGVGLVLANIFGVFLCLEEVHYNLRRIEKLKGGKK